MNIYVYNLRRYLSITPIMIFSECIIFKLHLFLFNNPIF